MSVFVIASISADGFIAPTGVNFEGPSTSWTSHEDTEFFKTKTKDAGVVIMGRTTYNTIPTKFRPLKDRLNIIYTSQPDSVKNSKPLSSFSHLKPETSNLAVTTTLPPKELISLLKAQSFQHLAICGGTSIYTLFLNAGVVDEIFLTIEPMLFGAGTPLIDKPLNTQLHLVNVIDLSDNTKVLHYQIV